MTSSIQSSDYDTNVANEEVEARISDPRLLIAEAILRSINLISIYPHITYTINIYYPNTSFLFNVQTLNHER